MTRCLARYLALASVAVLAAGCVGQPRIYLRPQPAAARPHTAPVRPAAQAATPRSAAPSSVPLSAAEKERLFREFQSMQPAAEP